MKVARVKLVMAKSPQRNEVFIMRIRGEARDEESKCVVQGDGFEADGMFDNSLCHRRRGFI
jgi:hypothetical protein